jgi:hypothetical protein
MLHFSFLWQAVEIHLSMPIFYVTVIEVLRHMWPFGNLILLDDLCQLRCEIIDINFLCQDCVQHVFQRNLISCCHLLQLLLNKP